MARETDVRTRQPEGSMSPIPVALLGLYVSVSLY